MNTVPFEKQFFSQMSLFSIEIKPHIIRLSCLKITRVGQRRDRVQSMKLNKLSNDLQPVCGFYGAGAICAEIFPNYLSSIRNTILGRRISRRTTQGKVNG